ncbi:hypothetical protein EX30DRAFT_200417 [Ascodesmis nigricans]|uniref:Uncharacterized protein n=1 Tax=Ascodesmis nigricans TaxID=341454 RepID=A0A4S2MQ59_9PEZI|nr:hypothetical protein EX30DRAFT_200417 [Ascodesmis nigricans]
MGGTLADWDVQLHVQYMCMYTLYDGMMSLSLCQSVSQCVVCAYECAATSVLLLLPAHLPRHCPHQHHNSLPPPSLPSPSSINSSSPYRRGDDYAASLTSPPFPIHAPSSPNHPQTIPSFPIHPSILLNRDIPIPDEGLYLTVTWRREKRTPSPTPLRGCTNRRGSCGEKLAREGDGVGRGG